MTAHKVFTDDGSHAGIGTITGARVPLHALQRLAAALLRDRRVAALQLVVRDGAQPGLYAFGEVDAAGLERLQHLSLQAHRVNRAARYVGYVEAERLSERLAARLVERYGRAEVRSFAYRAIPRGGTIVLGLLAYALDLPAAALALSTDTSIPLVLVDDCVISGVRFKQQWHGIGERRLILATLFAPHGFAAAAAAGAASATGSDRQFDHVCAVELPDLAPELYGDAYSAWYDAWHKRQGNEGLWIGQPEYLCFAWSEPESAFHNSVTGEIERGFTFTPSNRCLRLRHQPDGQLDANLKAGDRVVRAPESAAAVQVQRDGPGPLHVPPSVVAADLAPDRVAVASFAEAEGENSRTCFLLEGSAADMWRRLIDCGTVAEAQRALQERYAVDPAILAADLESLVNSLLQLGLLVHD